MKTSKLFFNTYSQMSKKEKGKAKRFIMNLAEIGDTTFHRWLKERTDLPRIIEKEIESKYNL